MIVISGALVLVALVLLVVGLTMTDLQFVYASIAVSLLAFVFLVIGILQRRGEQVPAGSSAGTAGDSPADDASGAPAAPTAAVDVSKRPAPAVTQETEPPVEDADVDEDLLEGGGLVLVVPGRPRYHVDGCRYLNGKDVEEVDVLDARDEGFTPCGVCKPDEVLAAEAEALDAALEEEDEQAEASADEPGDGETPAEVPTGGSRALEPAETQALETPVALAGKPARTAAKTAAKTAAGTAAKPAAKKAPAKTAAKAAAKKAPAEAAVKAVPAMPPLSAPPARSTAARGVPAAAKSGAVAAKAAPVKAAPVKEAAVSPAKAAAAASTPAAKSAAKKGNVVVIPDRGKFHQPDCRYVREADDALELTRAQAGRQGYAACGVCKP